MMASNIGGGDGDPGDSLDYALCFLCQRRSEEDLCDIATNRFYNGNMENQF